MAALGLFALCVLAFLLRSLGFEGVFLGEDVLFAAGDSYYHARIALWDFVNFPSILTFDSYINYPDGAAVPTPPLQDFVVAALARGLGGDPASLERVLAWWSPCVGALTPIPVYLAARRVGRVGVALGAAGLVAVMPILATASHVGNADHHALQALLGATLLWLCLAAVFPGARLRRIGWGLLAVRVAIALSWSGSLLYVLVADGLLLLTATLAARRDLLAMQALSVLASALILGSVVSLLPEPAGGPWWALSLSRLYPLALLAVAALAGAAFALERLRPQRSSAARLLGLIAPALLVG
ncbi:MAG: STT3 domain-containing protein, partial [Myxococcota bacterium]